MTTMKTYGIEITDFRKDAPRIIKLDGWRNAEDAAEAGWALLEVIAEFDPNLSYENQGDQFMAYYRKGVRDENGEDLGGLGAATIQVVNPDGTYFEDL